MPKPPVPAATENANVNANVQEGGKHKGKHAEAAMKTGSPSPAATAGLRPFQAEPGPSLPRLETSAKTAKQVDVQKIKASTPTSVPRHNRRKLNR